MRGEAGIVGEDLRLLRRACVPPGAPETARVSVSRFATKVLPKSEAGTGGRLRAEELDGVDALPGRRRPVHRQQPHRAEPARHRGGSEQLDFRRKRPRRQDHGGSAELCDLVRNGWRSIRSPGFTTFSRASPIIPSRDSTNFCPTAGPRPARRLIAHWLTSSTAVPYRCSCDAYQPNTRSATEAPGLPNR